MTVRRHWWVAALPFLVIHNARADERCVTPVATLVSAQGSIEMRASGGEAWVAVAQNAPLCAGDSVTVRSRSRAVLRLEREQTNVQLGENTTLVLPGSVEQAPAVLELLKGVTHFISRVPRALKINTPFVNAAVEGTEFVIQVNDAQALISVTEGHVDARNDGGQLLLASGENAVAKSGVAPAPLTIDDPMQMVQWALYYPPVIEFVPHDITAYGLESWRAVIADSIRALRTNDLKTALALLDQAGEGITSSRYLLYRAHLLLTVGRVAEAQADIDQVLASDGNSSAAWVMRTLVAVTQNRYGDALDAGRKAVEADPRSPAAHIALSYAYQARFDLDAALAEARAAAKEDEDSALAWARVAELQLMRGELSDALLAIERAEQLNPRSAPTKTVLGFANLTQLRFARAEELFRAATELDQAAPLPRLGLGLARIRQGDLAGGRAQIEIATSLDPRLSILRSYVGKAYYEEKRDKLAGEQFALAKELDPADPTPWFYDAIRKHGAGQLVEALQDAQKSTELNDNRAVYRSRLLLDEDIATRGVNTARIFQELGFSQAALAEAHRSLSYDPGNYSAHRFLAEAYAALPRHEIARVSEALQAQLLQPLTTHPLSPQQLEGAQSFLESTDVPSLGYGEYGALFVRNGLTARVAAMGGGDDSNGDELLVSAIANRLSFAVGRMRTETEGFRENADFSRTLINTLAQWAVTPNFNVQAEYRISDTENGDTFLRFDPENYSPSLREAHKFDVFRVGWHQRFSPRSHWIGSVLRREDDERSDESWTDPDFGEFSRHTTADKTSHIFEIQYAWHGEISHHRIGAGRFIERGPNPTTYTNEFLGVVVDPFKEDVSHNNFYYYSQWGCCRDFEFYAGLTWEYYKQNSASKLTRYQYNPKLGLQWEILPNTVFRAAVLRTLNRDLVSNQTIEPTVIAGFNQLFDDVFATRAHLGGIAVDQRFSGGASAGVEWTGRDMSVPFFHHDASRWIETDWFERTMRAYLYIPVSHRITLSIEHFMERFGREAENPGLENITALTTRRLPIGISWAMPYGLSTSLMLQHIAQNVNVVLDPLTLETRDDQDEFWYADFQIGYRFYQRWGRFDVGAHNLTDRRFHYQDMDPTRVSIYPHRVVYARVGVNF